MTGIRRSIYIPEDEVPGIEEAAHKMERSVSWYLINLHRESLGQKESLKPANPEKFKSHRAEPVMSATLPDDSESEASETVYDPGEVADTPPSVPEVEKPVSENPSRKATVKKLQSDIDGTEAIWGNAGKDFSKVTTANRGKGKKGE